MNETNKTRTSKLTTSDAATAGGDVTGMTIGANQESLGKCKWIKLTDYGEFPHARGLQRLSRESARSMVSYFNSLRGKLARRFGGLPVYIGHPDDPSFANQPGHRDTRAYAWIQAMDDREDGLWVLPKWGAAGRELLSNAFYKFLSPRWAMKAVEPGVFEPFRLLSVGLTNQPNIPCDAIANEKGPDRITQTLTSEKGNTMLEKIIDKIGLSLDATEEEIFERLDTTIANSRSWEEQSDELNVENKELRAEADRLYKLASDADQGRSDEEKTRRELETALANERKARIDLLLNDAIRNARISPVDREKWGEDLQEHFEQTAEALCNARPLLNTASRTAGLGRRKETVDRQRRFLEAVNTRMSQTGEGFATAWSNIKKDRKDLYEQLCRLKPIN